eukprot:760895-Hanusia_phi.AAC.1
MEALQRLSRTVLGITEQVDTIRDELHQVQAQISVMIRNCLQTTGPDAEGAHDISDSAVDGKNAPAIQHGREPPSKRMKMTMDAQRLCHDDDFSDDSSWTEESSFEDVLPKRNSTPKQTVTNNHDNKSQPAVKDSVIKRGQVSQGGKDPQQGKGGKGGQQGKAEKGGEQGKGGTGGEGGTITQGGGGVQGKVKTSSVQANNLSRQAILDELNLLGKRILDIESLRIIVSKYGCSKKHILTKMQVSRLSEMWDE